MAGFLDRLLSSIAIGTNTNEPLFGGLIPRRVEREDNRIISNIDTGPPPMPRPVGGPIRQTGMDKISKNMLGGSGDNRGMDTRIDYSGQTLDLGRARLGLDREKFRSDKDIAESELELKGREQDRKETEDKNRLDIDRDKQEIDHRKAALDEWKARNPKGDIKTDENGRIVIIDKRTGQSIDTGLRGEHFSEEEKLKLQAINASDLETQRQAGREKLKTPRVVNPTQQRVAEDDAAAELLRDPRYAWMADNGIISFDKDKGLIVDSKKLNETDAVHKSKAHLIEFEKDVKAKAGERMNKSFSSGVEDEDTTNVTTHDGRTIQIPKSKVEEFNKVKNEEEAKLKKPDNVKSAIEIIRDSGGRVVYSGNVKGKR